MNTKEKIWACAVEEEELKEQYLPMAGGVVPLSGASCQSSLRGTMIDHPWGSVLRGAMADNADPP